MANPELDQMSLIDTFVDIRPDIKILESFSYPIGTVCLLQKGEETCVLNINLSSEGTKTIYSSFQEPNNTLRIYSCFFLELRKGYDRLNFDSIPNTIFGVPDFIQIRQTSNEEKSA